jgi:hypothetical protein
MSIHLVESNIDIQVSNKTNEPIYLFQQFFIHKSNERYNEIKQSLRRNVQLGLFKKIYLLNERIYTNDELGLTDKEMKLVKQINIGTRMMYSDVFKQFRGLGLNGYIVIANSDIFFDKTIENLNKSCLSTTKSFMAQLRYEYDNNEKLLMKQKIFGPRPDSQDVWILHSNYIPTKKQFNIFDILLGKPGCDNKICYLFYILGYKLYNDPSFIRTYHYHKTQTRDYTAEDVIDKPFLYLFPKIASYTNIEQYINDNINESFMKSVRGSNYFIKNYKSHILHNHASNKYLGEFIKNKLENNKHFIIPRVAGVEHMLAMTANKYLIDGHFDKMREDPIIGLLDNMHNNAGINIKTEQDLIIYSQTYLEAFKNSELYAVWEHFSNVYETYHGKFAEVQDKLVKMYSRDKYLSSFSFDIFHHVYDSPWTHSLKGKRILIVSNFMDTIKKQMNHINDIYGTNLFPECTFIYVRPPQTACGNGGDEPWLYPFKKLCDDIYNIKEQFDIALCSCGGYGNPLLNFIYSLGKSAIYVGGVLQMYFGIIGSRWENERADVLKAFKNDYWRRPLISEIPVNKEKVEGGCYW